MNTRRRQHREIVDEFGGFEHMISSQKAQQGRTVAIRGPAPNFDQDVLVTQWRDPKGVERDVQIEVTLNWNSSAPAASDPLNFPNVSAVLASPAIAGHSVGVRYRWSTGSLSRDTLLDLNVATFGNSAAYSAVSARGSIVSLRASQVDVWLTRLEATNTTIAGASIAPATARAGFAVPHVGFAGAHTIALAGLIRLPQYAQEIKLIAANPATLVSFYAPDLSTVVEAVPASNLIDWYPLHSAAVLLATPNFVSADATRAVFR